MQYTQLDAIELINSYVFPLLPDFFLAHVVTDEQKKAYPKDHFWCVEKRKKETGGTNQHT